MQWMNFDKGREHAIDFDLHAVFALQQHAAAGAALTAHDDSRLNAHGRTVISDNLKQDRPDGNALADRDVYERTGRIVPRRGEHQAVLVERISGEQWPLRSVLQASPRWCAGQVVICAQFQTGQQSSNAGHGVR
jgi:hypothetical protein